jgi:hypothetical protein
MIEIKKSQDNVISSLNKIQKQLETLAPGAYKVWLENTPVRTGNAKRSTRLRQSTSTKGEIDANYDYAVPLDQGRSRKSPQGMSRPTLAWLNKTLRSIMRK